MLEKLIKANPEKEGMRYLFALILVIFIAGCCCEEEDKQSDGLGAYPPASYDDDEEEDTEPPQGPNPCTDKEQKTYANVSISMNELNTGQTEYTCSYSVQSCEDNRVDFYMRLEDPTGNYVDLTHTPSPHHARLNQSPVSGTKTWKTFGDYDSCFLYLSDGTSVGTKPKNGASTSICTSSSDCGDNEVCTGGSCYKQCDSDAGCGDNLCNDNLCKPLTEIDESCDTDSDCDTLDTCVEEECYKSCSTHTDCSDNTYCLSCGDRNVCARVGDGKCKTCDIVSAEFSTNSVSVGDTVDISIQGQDCDQETVQVEIYRSCEGEGIDDSFVEMRTATFSGNEATTTWTVKDPEECHGKRLNGLVWLYGYQEIRDVDGYLNLD